MNEQEFDPRDTNKDGKVSVKEKLLDHTDLVHLKGYLMFRLV